MLHVPAILLLVLLLLQSACMMIRQLVHRQSMPHAQTVCAVSALCDWHTWALTTQNDVGETLSSVVMTAAKCAMQVLQTRKTSFVKNSPTFGPQKYHPDTHGNCTVLAGSKVVQVTHQ